MNENLPDTNVGNIEYISKQDAIDTAREDGKKIPTIAIRIMHDIKAIPAADVVPVVHAHWMPQKENYEFKEAWMKCSACGYPVSRWTGNTNFCPNCGAKMDGEREE